MVQIRPPRALRQEVPQTPIPSRSNGMSNHCPTFLAKFRCPECLAKFPKWSDCRKHFQETGHVDVTCKKDLQKRLELGEFRCKTEIARQSPSPLAEGSSATQQKAVAESGRESDGSLDDSRRVAEPAPAGIPCRVIEPFAHHELDGMLTDAIIAILHAEYTRDLPIAHLAAQLGSKLCDRKSSLCCPSALDYIRSKHGHGMVGFENFFGCSALKDTVDLSWTQDGIRVRLKLCETDLSARNVMGGEGGSGRGKGMETGKRKWGEEGGGDGGGGGAGGERTGE